VTRRLDRDVFRTPGGTHTARVARIGGDPLNGTGLPPEVPADDPHPCAVVVDDLGMSFARISW